jgi:hypothetical protein
VKREKNRNNGKLEDWSNGKATKTTFVYPYLFKPIIPVFHYSIIPKFY